MPTKTLLFTIFLLGLLASCTPAAEPIAPVVAKTTLALPSTFTPTPVHTPAPVIAPPATATTPPLVATSAPPSITATPEPAVPSVADQAGIYAAVVRQLYTVDHTFAQDPHFPTVYLMAATSGGFGHIAGEGATPRAIDPVLQQGVLDALATPSVKFAWVKDAGSAPRDENHRVAGGGCIVILGIIQPLTADKVALEASIYIGPLVAGGYSYVLNKIDGVWQITSSSMMWIS